MMRAYVGLASAQGLRAFHVERTESLRFVRRSVLIRRRLSSSLPPTTFLGAGQEAHALGVGQKTERMAACSWFGIKCR